MLLMIFLTDGWCYIVKTILTFFPFFSLRITSYAQCLIFKRWFLYAVKIVCFLWSWGWTTCLSPKIVNNIFFRQRPCTNRGKFQLHEKRNYDHRFVFTTKLNRIIFTCIGHMVPLIMFSYWYATIAIKMVIFLDVHIHLKLLARKITLYVCSWTQTRQFIDSFFCLLYVWANSITT